MLGLQLTHVSKKALLCDGSFFSEFIYNHMTSANSCIHKINIWLCSMIKRFVLSDDPAKGRISGGVHAWEESMSIPLALDELFGSMGFINIDTCVSIQVKSIQNRYGSKGTLFFWQIILLHVHCNAHALIFIKSISTYFIHPRWNFDHFQFICYDAMVI